jgi:hypothetical protein
VRFVIADAEEDNSDRVVTVDLADPKQADLRSAFLSAAEIDYGAHFILVGAPAGRMVAICTSGPFARANEPGEFLLIIDGEIISKGLSRQEVLTAFLSALDA